MSLIKQAGTLPVYKQSTGFKYPWAIEYYEAHDAMVWHKNEYTLSEDIQDYAKADIAEKTKVDNIMRLFVQNDVNKIAS